MYLDLAFTWGEVTDALQKLKRHKAPGNYGIPADVYKLAIGDEPTPIESAILTVVISRGKDKQCRRSGKIHQSYRFLRRTQEQVLVDNPYVRVATVVLG